MTKKWSCEICGKEDEDGKVCVVCEKRQTVVKGKIDAKDAKRLVDAKGD